MKRVLLLVGLILITLAIWFSPSGLLFWQNCKLDGKFGEWGGGVCLRDSKGDGVSGQDFKAIYWKTNINDHRLFFMVERYSANRDNTSFLGRIYFDVNDNGSYQDRWDKYAQITYQPDREDSGKVVVKLYTIVGKPLSSFSGRWGEGFRDGGSRFEFAIPMNDLDVYPAQSVRFYLSGISDGNDRLPNQGDNQWAPFPGSLKSRPGIAVAFLIWLGITAFFYRQRIWLFYYIWGAVGLSCLLILLFRGSFVEYQLERLTSLILYYLLNYLHILTYIFDKAPGTLLVLIKMDTSWTTIDIDIENSALMEICIICGLIIFYPAYSKTKRLITTLGGALCVYLANLIRLAVVIVAIHQGGRNMSFIAHTVLGRLVFFILIVAIYWQLITKPSLTKIKEQIKDA